MNLSSISGRAMPAAGIFLALAAGLVAIVPACGHEASSAAAVADDGWRHTAHGWERIDQWQTPAASPFASYWHPSTGGESLTNPLASMGLGQLHPGVFALAQIALVGGALALFPAQARMSAKP